MKQIVVVMLFCLGVAVGELQAGQAPAITDETVILEGPEARLTVGDFKRVLKSLPGNVVGPMLQMPKRLREVIDQTYLVMVAAERGRKAGLEKDPVFQAKMENYERNLLAGMVADRFVEANMPEESTLEALAREHYLANIEKYMTPEQVRARHILIRVEPGKDDSGAKRRIESIRQEIVAGKLDFAAAAKKYSEDKGSAAKGGDLGFFTRRRMVAPFSEVAFALAPGELSEPVRTFFGWHLILVEEKKPAQTKPFEAVKKHLIEEQRKQVKSDLRKRFWIELRDDPANKVNQQVMDRLLANPGLFYGVEKLPTPGDK